MARTKTKPQHVEPEDESQETPEPETPAVAPATRKPVKKADAARAALAAGIEAPQKAVAFIKTRFGIEMNPQHFSAMKSQIRKKEREGGAAPTAEASARRKPSAEVEGHLAPPPKAAGDAEPDLLAALETMKPLIAQLGAEKVKRIVDLLG